jgi:hypothetical protein
MADQVNHDAMESLLTRLATLLYGAGEERWGRSLRDMAVRAMEAIDVEARQGLVRTVLSIYGGMGTSPTWSSRTHAVSGPSRPSSTHCAQSCSRRPVLCSRRGPSAGSSASNTVGADKRVLVLLGQYNIS